jgi:hypothetical protein
VSVAGEHTSPAGHSPSAQRAPACGVGE